MGLWCNGKHIAFARQRSRFDSLQLHSGDVAPIEEHLYGIQGVVGANPTFSTYHVRAIGVTEAQQAYTLLVGVRFPHRSLLQNWCKGNM